MRNIPTPEVPILEIRRTSPVKANAEMCIGTTRQVEERTGNVTTGENIWMVSG